MKLIIDIDEEVLNKLPEAELGSNVIEDVLEAVENGTPLDEYENIFSEGLFDGFKISINAEIPNLSHYQSDDGQDLVMVADVLECINKHIGERSEDDL